MCFKVEETANLFSYQGRMHTAYHRYAMSSMGEGLVRFIVRVVSVSQADKEVLTERTSVSFTCFSS